MNIIIASHNANKVEEIKLALNPTMEVFSLNDISYDKEIIEFGETLEQNALIKAQALAKKYHNSIIIADDSGLEVKSLLGAPGVFSSRYAESEELYEIDKDLANNEKLLRELKNKVDRSAKFRTVLCIIKPNETPYFAHGVVEGEILSKPIGDHGFGYDPIFSHNGLNSFSQLSPEQKSNISHRSLAISNMIDKGIL